MYRSLELIGGFIFIESDKRGWLEEMTSCSSRVGLVAHTLYYSSGKPETTLSTPMMERCNFSPLLTQVEAIVGTNSSFRKKKYCLLHD